MSLPLPPVLIVDDEKNMRASLQTMLEDEGYSVCTAESAEEALKLIEDAGFRCPERFEFANPLIIKDSVVPGEEISLPLEKPGTQALIEVANTERDPGLRRQAIHSLGISGGNETVDALTYMYNAQTDVETKKQVIHSLFIHNAAKSLIELARKETNPELRQELVHRIALIHSPEATEYMMEILNK